MTKNVSFSDDAYAALAAMKREDESFSDLALRIAREHRRRSILEYAGAWKDDASKKDMLRKMYKARDESARPRHR